MPPVLIGFFVAPLDFVLVPLAMNLEFPPCTLLFVPLDEFFAAIFGFMWNPISVLLCDKYN